MRISETAKMCTASTSMYYRRTQAKATFSHTFNNDRTTAKIHIYKVDKETGKAVPQGDASLSGAVYGLYAREVINHPDGATGVMFNAGDLVQHLLQTRRAKLR